MSFICPMLNMHVMSKHGFSLYISVESAITCSDSVAVCADEDSILALSMTLLVYSWIETKDVAVCCLWSIL